VSEERDDWIDLGPADLESGELRGLEVGERLVLLASLRGKIHALDDSCNHAGCLLSGGFINERKAAVVCPCHEYAFELASGKNVTFPRLCGDQEAFETKVSAGRVLVRLGKRE